MSLNNVFSEQGHPKVQCATQGEILLGDSGDGQNLAFLGAPQNSSSTRTCAQCRLLMGYAEQNSVQGESLLAK